MQKKCSRCGGLISPEKLKFFPDTNICSAKCANQVKEMKSLFKIELAISKLKISARYNQTVNAISVMV